MFRYEVGATILIRRYDRSPGDEPVAVEILSKGPKVIRAMIMSDGDKYLSRGEIRILSSEEWCPICRLEDV